MERSGTVWCIDTDYYFEDTDDFSQTVELYGPRSREHSVGMKRLCKSAEDLEQLCPRSNENARAYVLLLDKDCRSIGYTILTA